VAAAGLGVRYWRCSNVFIFGGYGVRGRRRLLLTLHISIIILTCCCIFRGVEIRSTNDDVFTPSLRRGIAPTSNGFVCHCVPGSCLRAWHWGNGPEFCRTIHSFFFKHKHQRRRGADNPCRDMTHVCVGEILLQFLLI